MRGFPTGTGAKPVQLAEQLKTALQGDPHIHVNEVCFVPADSAVARSTVAQQLAAHTLGLNSQASDELFADPERLLQLIVAAEGSKGGRGGARGSGSGSGEGDGDGDGNGDGEGSGSGDRNGSGRAGSGYGTGGSGSGYGQGPGDGYGPGMAATVQAMPDPGTVRPSAVLAAVSITRPNQLKSLVIFLPQAEFLVAPARSTSQAQPMQVRFPALARRVEALRAAQEPARGISSAAASVAHRSLQMLPASGSRKESQFLRGPVKLPAANRQKVATSPKSAPDPAPGTSLAAPAAARR